MLCELPVDPTATLRDLPFRSLQIVYATWRGRVPKTVPRTVHVSAELFANPERSTYAHGLAAVLREIAEGADLRPRLSTAIDHAYALAPPPLLARRSGGRQYDRLLADWGIHHLHLSMQPHRRRSELLGRTKHVLFVAFQDQDAYLIDLRPHESDGANWSELAILETVVRNWPESNILQASMSALGLAHGNWTDEQRRELREAGVAGGLVEIDGRVWIAGHGGQSLAGTPSNVANHCMATSWFLSGYEPTEDELRAELTVMAAKHVIRDGPWQALVDGEDYGFYCEGVFVRYGSLVA